MLTEERLVYLVWRASAELPADYTPRNATFAAPNLEGLDDFQIAVAK